MARHLPAELARGLRPDRDPPVGPPGRLAADLTVMPLIANREYKPYLDLAEPPRSRPTPAIVARPSATRSWPSTRNPSCLPRGAARSPNSSVSQQVALGWLGNSVSLYLDDDAFWAGWRRPIIPTNSSPRRSANSPRGPGRSDQRRPARPVPGRAAGVRRPVAPNLTIWENREHQGHRYVRIAEAPGARPGANGPKFVLYYYATRVRSSPSTRGSSSGRSNASKGKPKPAPAVGGQERLPDQPARTRGVRQRGPDRAPRPDPGAILEQPPHPQRVEASLPRSRPACGPRGGLGARRLSIQAGAGHVWNARWEQADGIDGLRSPRRAEARARVQQPGQPLRQGLSRVHLRGWRPPRPDRGRTAAQPLIRAFRRPGVCFGCQGRIS